jgi:hypothetical protein
MSAHTFLLLPGTWNGEGTVHFNKSSNKLSFRTKWSVGELKDGQVLAEQTVWIEGVDDPSPNFYKFHSITKNSFKVTLQNQMLGTVHGKGVIDSKCIAWEFRENPGFEGFEIYKSDKENYSFHAEYTSSDQFRTIIDGHIKN